MYTEEKMYFQANVALGKKSTVGQLKCRANVFDPSRHTYYNCKCAIGNRFDEKTLQDQTVLLIRVY